MFRIAKEFRFESAHLLDGHDGQCRHLHGHSYRLRVEVAGEALQPTGPKAAMLLDYQDLKSWVETQILTALDHAFLYDRNSERECQIAALLQSFAAKTYALDGRTTCENLCRHIFDVLGADLPLSRIRLYETASSYCEYER